MDFIENALDAVSGNIKQNDKNINLLRENTAYLIPASMVLGIEEVTIDLVSNKQQALKDITPTL